MVFGIQLKCLLLFLQDVEAVDFRSIGCEDPAVLGLTNGTGSLLKLINLDSENRVLLHIGGKYGHALPAHSDHVEITDCEPALQQQNIGNVVLEGDDDALFEGVDHVKMGFTVADQEGVLHLEHCNGVEVLGDGDLP